MQTNLCVSKLTPARRLKRRSLLLCGGVLSVFITVGFVPHAAATKPTIHQAQSQLNELTLQIKQLKQTVARTQDKRGVLSRELGLTEKKIGFGVQKIRAIERAVRLKQDDIQRLQQQLDSLQRELIEHQRLFAAHIKARYKMGEYRSLVIALNQNDLQKINQLLTLYQYVLRAQQHSIDTMRQMQEKIAEGKRILEQELKAQQNLQAQLQVQQQKFEQAKSYQQVLIQSLNQEIHSQQHTLSEYEQNKANLSALLQTLVRESEHRLHPIKAFTFMHHQLPLPVKVKGPAIKTMNQGVIFLAPESTPVFAVYPGRVVFSDWLRGYGLLLILDHGHGFMTLYAHNQSLFQSKGVLVRQGQQIASVGHSGGLKENALYFEVRQRGKAVPPLAWLSTK